MTRGLRKVKQAHGRSRVDRKALVALAIVREGFGRVMAAAPVVRSPDS
jgi:hypothetical protein